MPSWQTLRADIILRLGGITLLASAWACARALLHSHFAVSVGEPTPVHYLLATGAFLCGSAGAMLTGYGRHIFDRIEVSPRWRRMASATSPSTCTR